MPLAASQATAKRSKVETFNARAYANKSDRLTPAAHTHTPIQECYINYKRAVRVSAWRQKNSEVFPASVWRLEVLPQPVEGKMMDFFFYIWILCMVGA